jgi:hypothetical protein
MKMVSGEIEVESPVVVYDYATADDHVVGEIRVGQALAALGEPESPSELAQRLAVAVAMLWPEVADADVFLPEKGRPLRGVRDARAGAQLLASLHAVWGPIATRGLMPVTPTLLPGDVAAGRGVDDVDADLFWQVARRLPGRAAHAAGAALHRE